MKIQVLMNDDEYTDIVINGYDSLDEMVQAVEGAVHAITVPGSSGRPYRDCEVSVVLV